MTPEPDRRRPVRQVKNGKIDSLKIKIDREGRKQGFLTFDDTGESGNIEPQNS